MNNRKSLITLYLTAVLFLIAAPSAFAGHGQGSMDGTGPVINITDGTPVQVAGIVADIGTPGAGMAVDTGTEIISVFGIGPVRFWDSLNIARPQIGEQVVVNGYEVTLSDGSTRIIATDITVNDTTISLRDADTGTPAWRGTGGSGSGSGSGAGQGTRGQGRGLRDGSCLY